MTDSCRVPVRLNVGQLAELHWLLTSDESLAALIRQSRTIAIVGLSPQPERASYRVAVALQALGKRVVPVRPGGEATILGEQVYPSLADVPCPIDLVNVFRAPEHVNDVVAQCIAVNAPAIWLQEGVVNVEAAGLAYSAGMSVVMDRCIKKDMERLLPTNLPPKP